MKIRNERYVCLIRRSHPRIKAHLTLEQFVAARHVYVTAPSSGHGVVEDVLRAQGIRRKIALQVGHFTSVPSIVAQTDMIATMPSRVAKVHAHDRTFRVLPLPIKIPDIGVTLHWHARAEADPANAWMRDQISLALHHL